MDGPPPSAGTPAFFTRHVDDEAHYPATADPSRDFIEVWTLHVDFAAPANSTFALADTVAVTEFDSDLCGLQVFSCFRQPGTAVLLDPNREVVMHKLQLRDFGAYQTLVGNFVTDVDGTDHGGVRWFELRRPGTGAWTLYQDGTWSLDADHRWLGTSAMDGAGNIALGYSVSGFATFPSMRYTARLAGDSLGTMTVAEVTAAAGAGSQTSFIGWGDHAAMSVDPVDECTFWFASEYILSNGRWQTHVARFRFDPPDCTDAPAPVCGNAVREIGEDCDGTDANSCPGLCSAGCTCPAPTCGNDVVEVGEECDGLSAAACGGALCVSDCTCRLCPPVPLPGCRQAGVKGTTLTIRRPGQPSDALVWNWKRGEETSVADFGNPITNATNVALCLWDASGAPQPLLESKFRGAASCQYKALNKPCWTATPTGFKYVSSQFLVDGSRTLALKAGAAGKATVKLKAKRAFITAPALPLVLPVTAQVVVRAPSSNACFEGVFAAPLRNDASLFKAVGP